jgi:hypothetical protein
LSFDTKAYLAMIGLICVPPEVCVAVYEYRHPCIRDSTHRAFVEELTTYTSIDPEHGLMMVPNATPAHYEEETVCEARK